MEVGCYADVVNFGSNSTPGLAPCANTEVPATRLKRDDITGFPYWHPGDGQLSIAGSSSRKLSALTLQSPKIEMALNEHFFFCVASDHLHIAAKLLLSVHPSQNPLMPAELSLYTCESVFMHSFSSSSPLWCFVGG